TRLPELCRESHRRWRKPRMVARSRCGPEMVTQRKPVADARAVQGRQQAEQRGRRRKLPATLLKMDCIRPITSNQSGGLFYENTTQTECPPVPATDYVVRQLVLH